MRSFDDERWAEREWWRSSGGVVAQCRYAHAASRPVGGSSSGRQHGRQCSGSGAATCTGRGGWQLLQLLRRAISSARRPAGASSPRILDVLESSHPVRHPGRSQVSAAPTLSHIYSMTYSPYLPYLPYLRSCHTCHTSLWPSARALYPSRAQARWTWTVEQAATARAARRSAVVPRAAVQVTPPQPSVRRGKTLRCMPTLPIPK